MEQFSQSELAKHHDVGDLWVSICGKVYNISGYVDDHPGGVEVLKDVAGSDGTESFEYVGHSEDAYKTLQRFQIGVLEDHVGFFFASQRMPIANHTFPKAHQRRVRWFGQGMGCSSAQVQ
ncbi:Cytochrome b5 [Colletotrichum higginsianum IMI 349063]|uniref:Cytochrome b5 n=2 Tax=Colletotrichum higginsianum (strain IMI 349063) TaxID=759273 RepID=A0A1B7XSG8_COLHI|nr:Cytochrome b5 [Colletotrichum higginsianum IMI 349063]OBR02687.1 Cytochrome b5 [Colletotrichum higginsianum IMI 349063]